MDGLQFDAAVKIHYFMKMNRPTADKTVFDKLARFVARVKHDFDFTPAVWTLHGFGLQ
jgi:hypothetical protein